MRKVAIYILVLGLLFAFGCKGKKSKAKSHDGSVAFDKHVKEGFVKVDEGIELRYKKIGEGHEMVIIPAAIYLECEFKKLQGKSRTLVFYDTRGRGKSSQVTDASKLGMDIEVADLEKLRQHLKKKKVSLIGWSYLGGMVALYASQYPDHVNRVIQIDPISPTYEIYMTTAATPVDSKILTQLKKLQEGDLKTSDPEKYCNEYWNLYLKRIFFDQTKIALLKCDICKCDNEMPDNVNFVLGSIFGGLGEWSWLLEMKNVNVPVLVIHGAQDSLPMDGSRLWASYMPNARLMVVPEAGHLPFVEQPDPFYSAVDTFLKGEWPEKSESLK